MDLFLKKKKKKGDKTFFVSVWLKGGEETKLVGLDCFLLGPTKIFSLQIGEKLERTKMDRHGKRAKIC